MLIFLTKCRYKFLKFGQSWIEKKTPFLAPFSWIWGAVSFCRNWLYDHQILPIHSVPCVVVSIGNIVAGGTGKTPLVHLLARQFSHRKVALLSRGYGGMADEANLLARRLPFLKVYVGKDRAALAQVAVKEGAALLILDDGFQHRRLKRDFDFVILKGSDPWGQGHYIPWGFLRDSPKRLSQANALFIQGASSLALEGGSYIVVEPLVTRILDFEEREVFSIQGWEVGLFCGIGNPAQFKKTAESLGVKIIDTWILADHEPADIKNLQKFSLRCKSLGARVLLCTEKDFVKLPIEMRVSLPILFLEIELQISKGFPIWQKLVEKIDQEIDNAL